MFFIFLFVQDAVEPCVFTREEFARGCSALSILSPASGRARLASMRRTLTDGPSGQRDALYDWAFKFLVKASQAATQHQSLKSITKEIAVLFWPVLLPEWPLVGEFASFVTGA